MTYAEWREWVVRIFGSEEEHLKSIPRRAWYRSWEEEGKWYSMERLTESPPEFKLVLEDEANGQG